MAKKRIELQLDPARLASIIDRAVVASSQIVNFHFNALDNADLSHPVEPIGIRHRFRAVEMSAADRRAMHESWILARAFHELLRAVRHSLEEAYVFVKLLTRVHPARSSATLAEFLKPFQSKAASLKFPRLLEAVNAELDPKIEFAPAYASLQVARNCLEHRNGMVSRIETHSDETFDLRIPRLKIFYLRNGTEVEVDAGHRVDPGDDRRDVEVFMKLEVKTRSFAFGERLTLSLTEFNEIGFACHFLGQQLSTRLPKSAIANT